MKVKLTERSYHCLNPPAEKQPRSRMHSPFSKVHIPKGHDIEPLAKTNTENVEYKVHDFLFPRIDPRLFQSLYSTRENHNAGTLGDGHEGAT